MSCNVPPPMHPRPELIISMAVEPNGGILPSPAPGQQIESPLVNPFSNLTAFTAKAKQMADKLCFIKILSKSRSLYVLNACSSKISILGGILY